MSPVAGPDGRRPDPPDDAAVKRRWERRLACRRRLLEDAQRDRGTAKDPATRADAMRRVALRELQVAYAERVLERREPPKPTRRERAVRAAMLCVKHRDQITYTQHAPARWSGIRLGKRAHLGGFPPAADCSSFVTWCLWDALGGPKAEQDVVNGERWRGGYTGTQRTHGAVVSLAHARAGDLLFYRGPDGTIDHVAILVAKDRAVSHGSQAGPQLVRPDYRPIAQIRSYLL